MTPPIRCLAGVDGALPDADVVVTATSADTVLVTADHLRPGTIVCDVARPANVAADVAQQRGLLVFEGGLVQLPQRLNLGSILGMTPGVCWGCLGETILLALEGEAVDCSIGGKLSLVDAEQVAGLARKHGFRSAPLQWSGGAGAAGKLCTGAEAVDRARRTASVRLTVSGSAR